MDIYMAIAGLSIVVAILAYRILGKQNPEVELLRVRLADEVERVLARHGNRLFFIHEGTMALYKAVNDDTDILAKKILEKSSEKTLGEVREALVFLLDITDGKYE